MDALFERSILLKAFSRIQGVIEKRTTMPSLSHALIETNNNTITLSATNLEVGLIAEYPAKIITPGKITIEAKKFAEIIKEIPSQEIKIREKEGHFATISAKKITYNLAVLSPEDFPSMEDASKTDFSEVQASRLRKIINRTSFAISPDEPRAALRGALLVFCEGEGLRMVTTDGHRLALSRCGGGGFGEDIKKGIIIPRRGVTEIKRLADECEDDEPAQVGVDGSSAILKVRDVTLQVRLLEGEFPNYEQIMSLQNENRLTVERKEMVGVIRRIGLLSLDTSKTVRFTIKKNLLSVSSSDPQLGNAMEEVGLEYDGQEVEIGFNARYLLDILGALEEERIVMEIGDEKKPVLFKPDGEADSIYVLMPIVL
jgi:DNA polymerase-3 subunit beta